MMSFAVLLPNQTESYKLFINNFIYIAITPLLIFLVVDTSLDETNTRVGGVGAGVGGVGSGIDGVGAGVGGVGAGVGGVGAGVGGVGGIGLAHCSHHCGKSCLRTKS